MLRDDIHKILRIFNFSNAKLLNGPQDFRFLSRQKLNFQCNIASDFYQGKFIKYPLQLEFRF